MFMVEESGMEEVGSFLSVLASQLEQAMQIIPAESATRVAQLLSDAAPKGQGEETQPIEGDEPGHLSASFQVEAEGTTADVITIQPQKIAYVRYGTAAHGPTNKKALHWVAGGTDVFAQWVQGIPANDFVSPIVESGGEIAAQVTAETLATLGSE